MTALYLVGLLPVELVAQERVDVVHYNHHYSDDGQLLLEQVWWETWRDDTADHAIQAWRVTKPCAGRSPIPLRNVRTGEWESIWFDGDVLRRVRARSFRESWTQGQDPELFDRQQHPDWRRTRRELSNIAR
jgi:hypothetical protein